MRKSNQTEEQKGVIEIVDSVSQERFGQQVVTFIESDGEYWYRAKEMCEILSFGDTRVVHKFLSPRQIGTTFAKTDGGKQAVLIINEPGLSRLILKSKSEVAKVREDELDLTP